MLYELENVVGKLNVDGKALYEVFIKIRDKSGKQVAKRKRFSTEREAKRCSQRNF